MDMLDFEERLKKLEDWRSRIDIERAKEEVDRKHIDGRFDRLEASISEFKTQMRWLNTTIVGAVVVYLVGFALRGGFNLPGIGG